MGESYTPSELASSSVSVIRLYIFSKTTFFWASRKLTFPIISSVWGYPLCTRLYLNDLIKSSLSAICSSKKEFSFSTWSTVLDRDLTSLKTVDLSLLSALLAKIKPFPLWFILLTTDPVLFLAYCCKMNLGGLGDKGLIGDPGLRSTCVERYLLEGRIQDFVELWVCESRRRMISCIKFIGWEIKIILFVFLR